MRTIILLLALVIATPALAQWHGHDGGGWHEHGGWHEGWRGGPGWHGGGYWRGRGWHGGVWFPLPYCTPWQAAAGYCFPY